MKKNSKSNKIIRFGLKTENKTKKYIVRILKI